MARICVFCASSERIHPAHLELARQVGAELARRGRDLASSLGLDTQPVIILDPSGVLAGLAALIDKLVAQMQRFVRPAAAAAAVWATTVPEALDAVELGLLCGRGAPDTPDVTGKLIEGEG